ncbi:dehydrogenase [Pelobium manganitolerans]|uniref:Dehydrogenase n=1 Tax=Pelobium manganitolerans TaxID=1842495 RepID=A0A419S232_9SPHI|nr:Gfo/Idh/MocA family oxidoreductase [Pelobium manganitolerans]RKD12778.1 dehydrogenase [Pelobium manganitolerans]
MRGLKRRTFLKQAGIAGLSFSLTPSFALEIPRQSSSKKIGIIGLDTSHSVAFTKAINGNPERYQHYKVVVAYPYGTQTITSAAERIPKYVDEVRQMGVGITGSITELLRQVDVVLLETNDGRMHLPQASQVIHARKPLFIDKPIAASLLDAEKIFDLALKKNVPVFSSSSLRYMPNVQAVAKGEYGKITAATSYSPAIKETTHPDLYWYGIHGVETLFAVMGTGCKTVTSVSTSQADVVTGIWDDGRVATFTGMPAGPAVFGGTCICEKGVVQLGPYTGYEPLLLEIIKFFDTGVSPVSSAETLEILAFMDAASESKRRGSLPIALKDMFNK